MKKYLAIAFLLNAFLIFSLEGETDFVDSLSGKTNATFDDAVISFCYLNGIEVSDDFQSNVDNLKAVIKYMPKKFSKEKQLTFGDFSLLAIQQLNIKSGLMYLITKSGRYANRELMIINIIPYNTSEWNRMSGMDLLKYIQKVADYAAEN